MSEETPQSPIEEARVSKMMARIIKLEKGNIQTKHYSDREMVKRIKDIIREEAEAHAD